MVLKLRLKKDQIEPKLTFETFYHCASLISIKFSSHNYILRKSQVQPLIRSLGLEHHIENVGIPSKLITIEGAGKETHKSNCQLSRNKTFSLFM